jgi:hypothetical protein
MANQESITPHNGTTILSLEEIVDRIRACADAIVAEQEAQEEVETVDCDECGEPIGIDQRGREIERHVCPGPDWDLVWKDGEVERG